MHQSHDGSDALDGSRRTTGWLEGSPPSRRCFLRHAVNAVGGLASNSFIAIHGAPFGFCHSNSSSSPTLETVNVLIARATGSLQPHHRPPAALLPHRSRTLCYHSLAVGTPHFTHSTLPLPAPSFRSRAAGRAPTAPLPPPNKATKKGTAQGETHFLYTGLTHSRPSLRAQRSSPILPMATLYAASPSCSPFLSKRRENGSNRHFSVFRDARVLPDTPTTQTYMHTC